MQAWIIRAFTVSCLIYTIPICLSGYQKVLVHLSIGQGKEFLKISIPRRYFKDCCDTQTTPEEFHCYVTTAKTPQIATNTTQIPFEFQLRYKTPEKEDKESK